ncbi:HAD family hydrolase [Vibrio renipiscarius]|uniref:Hydrolase n=1 Tax=Vibrio renipiscarius TaxID=1461322 RepID=A0A0C2KBU2_9VIBR|nr:HAD family hydrolase [Vibrio renipiscarius]KII79538.1 hydrolase [Vibrio renipiscarius]KII80834.1 hydrolase [Vibrio renipiscarius]
MGSIYLFDWGDTLMVDFPQQQGKMCDWATVQPVSGALETLEQLSKTHEIYVATNAADSSEVEIKSAFERVGLAQFISGYFCKANLGIGKGTPGFYHKIAEVLGREPHLFVMVGDTYDKDIEPASAAGIKAIWFNPEHKDIEVGVGVKQIHHLSELCCSRLDV